MNRAPDLLLPPHSVEAEQSLLGGLLLDNSAWDRIADLVSAEDFYRDDHKRLFRHLGHLIDAGKPADIVTVWEAVQAFGEGDQVGGLAYLGEIANNTPSAANIRRYAEIVSDKRRLRDLMQTAWRIQEIATEKGQQSAQSRIDEANGLLLALAEGGPARNDPRPIGDVLGRVVDAVQERYDREGTVAGLSCGLSDLDTKLCGLHGGDLVIVAGRSSMGKTALALNIAEHVALSKHAVLVFSMEMSAEQLCERALSSVGRIDGDRLRSGKRMTDDDFSQMTYSLSKLHSAPLIIDDSPALSVAQVRARARRVARQHGLALVVVDYLQLMRGEGDSREQEVAGISRGLKALAKEMGIPVIAVSQLSRKVEDRGNKRPLLSDLRESGAIEQDADVVLMLYRDDYYNPDSQEKGLAECAIAKQRRGPTGIVRLVWQAEYSRFADASHEAVEAARQRAHAAKPVRRRGFKED